MLKTLKLVILVIILLKTFSMYAFADNIIEINQLIENAKELDGTKITVQGETIGELMQRGEYCWVNINDKTNAIGIWMNVKDAEQIIYYGNYKNIGDTIKVSGIFHRACIEHGGEADIHCDLLTVVKKGYQVTYPIPDIKIIVAIALFLILFTGCIAIYYFMILKKST